MVRFVLLALVVVACAACGSKPRGGDDAVVAPRPDGSAGGGSASSIDAAPPATGDLQIRVEWKNVPAGVRASPGKTPCNTPRPPAVSPTTTWGIPDAFVIVEGATVRAEARVVLADCALAPRVAGGASLLVESAVTRPAKVTLLPWGKLAAGDVVRDAALGADALEPIQLPIAGHAVAIPLTANAIYRLATDADPAETSYVIAGPAFITDASGQILVEDLAAGPHTITAWLPGRSGQPDRIAKQIATIKPDEQVDLVLALEPR